MLLAVKYTRIVFYLTNVTSHFLGSSFSVLKRDCVQMKCMPYV